LWEGTRTGLINTSAGKRSGPQGLKPALLSVLNGTAEAGALPKTIYETSSRGWRLLSVSVVALLLVVLVCRSGAVAYSVPTHEEIVDLPWSDEICPCCQRSVISALSLVPAESTLTAAPLFC
jgi:hypothetical protein